MDPSERASIGNFTHRHVIDAFGGGGGHNNIAVAKPTFATPTIATDKKAAVTTAMSNVQFEEGILKTLALNSPKWKEKGRTAPKIICALTDFVQKQVLGHKRCIDPLAPFFNGITLSVPERAADPTNPLLHALQGQKLLVVDWELFFPQVRLQCPNCKCGTLKRHTTTWADNGTIFPIFTLHGAPMCALVQQYKCGGEGGCRNTIRANEGRLLNTLPPFMSQLYPVEPIFAASKKQHISRSATQVLRRLMVTYSGGDQFSRMLFETIHDDYVSKTLNFLSECQLANKTGVEYLPDKEIYRSIYPPQGDTIRKDYNEAAKSTLHPYSVSDHDRYTLEIQAVGCSGTMAEDHTFQVTKNYMRGKDGTDAQASWAACNESGEIGSAGFVKTTKMEEAAHYAEQLIRRPHWNPTGVYSDRCPKLSHFWRLLLGPVFVGVLGLFHFIQRITRTLRTHHIDHSASVGDLLDCIYEYDDEDYDKLVIALQKGKLGEVRTAEEIKPHTKEFRDRYEKYLRKKIRKPGKIYQKLLRWKITYKYEASPGKEEGKGRLDPRTGQRLFTLDTHDALVNAGKSSQHIQDPEEYEKMYREKKPSKKQQQTHGLSEWVSLRPESKLESWHSHLVLYANCGMTPELADNLNLQGTAKYNRDIRHKIRMEDLSDEEKEEIPVGWLNVNKYNNHMLLDYINKMAENLKSKLPFTYVEKTQQDTGERFFNEALVERPTIAARKDKRCDCVKCASNPVLLRHIQQTTDACVVAEATGETTEMPIQQEKKRRTTTPAANKKRVAVSQYTQQAEQQHKRQRQQQQIAMQQQQFTYGSWEPQRLYYSTIQSPMMPNSYYYPPPPQPQPGMMTIQPYQRPPRCSCEACMKMRNPHAIGAKRKPSYDCTLLTWMKANGKPLNVWKDLARQG